MKNYKKTKIVHPEIHISCFNKDHELPNLLFIHGGPGLNAGILEYLIEQENIFGDLNANIITYDQRNCGKSTRTNKIVSHQDNINDLIAIVNYLGLTKETQVDILVGHSYGAKLLYDYSIKTKTSLPTIYISCADSILTPRINNLILDMNYLMMINPDKYNQIFSELEDINHKNIWSLSEKIASIFHENKNRSNFYWANLNIRGQVKEIERIVNQPMNVDVFDSVRKDLYLDNSNYKIDLTQLNNKYLKINGLHDLVMGAAIDAASGNVEVFGKSSHYPHLEESEKFCGVVNGFIN